jgi:hypothetical protein
LKHQRLEAFQALFFASIKTLLTAQLELKKQRKVIIAENVIKRIEHYLAITV